jgi:hypothetical protein
LDSWLFRGFQPRVFAVAFKKLLRGMVDSSSQLSNEYAFFSDQQKIPRLKAANKRACVAARLEASLPPHEMRVLPPKIRTTHTRKLLQADFMVGVPCRRAQTAKIKHKILRLRFPSLMKARWTLLRSG